MGGPVRNEGQAAGGAEGNASHVRTLIAGAAEGEVPFPLVPGMLHYPTAIVALVGGDFVVCDSQSRVLVMKQMPHGVNAIVRKTIGCSGNGPCEFNLPTALAVAHDRAEGGLAIAAARKRRSTRTLQLNVASDSVGPYNFAEQDCPSVAKLRREATELVP